MLKLHTRFFQLLPKLLVSFLLMPAVLCAGNSQSDECKARRAELRKGLDGTIVLFGAVLPQHDMFSQEPNFYYLTGWNQSGAMLLLSSSKEILFLPRRDERMDRFNGRQIAPDDSDIREATGFDVVLPTDEFEAQLASATATAPKVYALTAVTDNPTAINILRMRNLLPMRDISDAGSLIGRMRMHKSAAELAAMQHSIDIALEAHRVAWKRIVPGMTERQVAAIYMEAFLSHDCETYAYYPNVSDGVNSTILHHRAGKSRINAGDILLIDSAPRCDYYMADITRTIPPSGKYTARQREVYEVEFGAQKAAIAAVRPGITMTELRKIAVDYMDAHGKDLKGNPLGQYFTHNIGHHIGLDVTDPKVTDTLVAGNVITIEPGIYIPDEALGIRIEDMVLVTENGYKVLSAALPKDPDQIEKLLIK